MTNENQITNVYRAAETDDSTYKTAAGKTPKSVTTAGGGEGALKALRDIQGAAESVLADIREPVLSVKGWLDIAISSVELLTEKFAVEIDAGISKAVSKVGDAADGFITGVTAGVGSIFSPSTGPGWVQAVKGAVVGAAGSIGRALTKGASWLGSGVKRKLDDISDNLDGKVSSFLGDAAAIEAYQELGFDAVDIGLERQTLFQKIGITALDSFNTVIKSASKAVDPEALSAKGTAVITAAKKRFNDELKKLPVTVRNRVTSIAETTLNEAASPVTNAIDVVQSQTAFIERKLQNVANVFNKSGDKLSIIPVAAVTAINDNVTLDEIAKADVPVDTTAVLYHKRSKPTISDQLISCVDEISKQENVA